MKYGNITVFNEKQKGLEFILSNSPTVYSDLELSIIPLWTG